MPAAGRLAAARARQLARKGRTMSIRRVAVAEPLAYHQADARGFSAAAPDADPMAAAPGQAQRRRRIELDELPPGAAFPIPPRHGDELLDGDEAFAVEAAERVWDGGTPAGWRLWVVGGGGA